jgi:diguanylate cyclase (GGDEF)-like protein
MLKVSASALQRAVVAVLAVVTVAAALGTALALRHDLDSGRSGRLDDARHHISDALRARAYYLEDVADMVGVHDDADATEFSRYAHVRGRTEGAIVGVQWLRRAPDGHLQPPRETGPDPILVPGSDDRKLVDAAHADAAGATVRAASLGKRVAVSAPVELADGDRAFYLAVPVEAHRFSGEVSKAESQSAIVGLIDAQKLVAAATPGQKLSVADGSTPLAALGGTPRNAAPAVVEFGGRTWALNVDGGSLSGFERVLPWLILAFGLAVTATVALVLRQSQRRRDAALRLARTRSEELSVTLQRVERTNHELELARAEADRLSRVDPLTGIFNRRHFREVLSAELELNESGPAAVLMLDLDHFKSVNDRHGHSTGDAILRAAAERIDSITRGSDCLARWGGEEFALLAPGLNRDGATELAERARTALAEEPVAIEDAMIDLTLSVGVAVLGPETHTADDLLDAADEALYDAKRSGRNCVRVFEHDGALDAT